MPDPGRFGETPSSGLPAHTCEASDAPTRTASASVVSAEAPPVASLLAPGQHFGAYTIVRLLGRGGMGEVYEAEEEDSGRRVALKLLNRPIGDAADRERFLREGRLAASISHPHCVYVFGTDEIQGFPVISMELAAGGTLKDMVKAQGALPPREAVDAILQVLAGLEAAAAAGVLHRDVKPANCFVDRDGTVKIGDFGLSISTLARDETHLTLAGTIMGTPAFASPDQLRGEELDVRSDIYSVGATLYSLLTGRAPFEESNIVRLITMVVQEMPPAPHTVRREVPKGLSAVVLRALAKRPADRFADYAALRTALEPFGSAAPVPAVPGLRIAAYFADQLILGMVSNLLLVVFAAVQTRDTIEFTAAMTGTDSSFRAIVLSPFLSALYWLLNEGLSGASPGKHILGLRVAGRDGEPAGFSRVLFRTLVFVGVQFVFQTLPWLLPLPGVQRVLAQTTSHPALLVLGAALSQLILFATARRRNGWAGLHELVGPTRVVAKHRREHAPVRAASTAEPAPIRPLRVGPYALVGDSASVPRSGVFSAWDDKLRRPVWIHFVAGGAAVPGVRRELARPARLRWLVGKRSGITSWDAYEAVDGGSFLQAVESPKRWGVVRGWLRDLSEEVRVGLADGSLPALGLDRLWVGSDGRIRLLDWPAPGSGYESDGSERADPTPADLAAAQRFLALVAHTALAGRPTLESNRDARPSPPLPLAASAFVSSLGGARFTSAGEIAAKASAIASGPTTVSRGRRALPLALSGPLFLTAAVLAPLAVIPILMALIVPGGPMLRLVGIAIVDRAGRETRRWRSALRAFVAWSLVGGGPLVQVIIGPQYGVWVAGSMLLLFLAGVVYAVVRPERGIQDRITGTWLVLR